MLSVDFQQSEQFSLNIQFLYLSRNKKVVKNIMQFMFTKQSIEKLSKRFVSNFIVSPKHRTQNDVTYGQTIEITHSDSF